MIHPLREKKAVTTALFTLLMNAPAFSESKPKAVLEEVIVSAKKTESSLQDAAMSIAALDSAKLEAEGISSLEDMMTNVPSLSISNFPTNNSTLSIHIRGIGNPDSQITQDSAVAVYLDGIYIARNTGLAMEVADLERIEVLKGPEGTLYGRNATGGAISMVTKRPAIDELEFTQKLTAGNRGLLSRKTSINIPVTDNLAVKLAYLRSQEDGFVDNKGPGGDWGDREVSAYRLDIRWNVSDTVAVDYSYDYLDMDFYNYTFQAIQPAVASGGTQDLILQTANSKVEQGPGFTEKRLDRLDSYMPLEVSVSKVWGHSLIITKDFENHELKYLLGFRNVDNSAYIDLGSGAADAEYRLDPHEWTAPNGDYFPLVNIEVTQDQISHEIQLVGDLFDGTVSYVSGLVYFEEEARDYQLPLYKQFTGRLDPPADSVTIGAFVGGDYNIENDAIAAYFQGEWSPSWDWAKEQLTFTLGGRYSEDSRSADVLKLGENRLYTNTPLGVELTPARTSNSFAAAPSREYDDLSVSAIIAYAVSDNIKTYLKRVEAYRTGGFNLRDPHRDRDAEGNEFGFGFIDGYDQEKVTNYELGIKSELLERTLRLNAAIYQMHYDDQQVAFTIPGASVGTTKVTNAGNSVISGMEMDVFWIISHSLQASFNYSYLDPEFKEIVDPSTGEDKTDDFVYAKSPKHSGSVSLNWRIKESEWGTVGLYTSYSYAGEQIYDAKAAFADETAMRARKLLNMRLGISDMAGLGGRFDMAIWGKNLTDQEYEIQAIHQLPHAIRGVIWGEPRSYGLDITYRF